MTLVYVWMVSISIIIGWEIWRGRRSSQDSYLLALDHVEQMTKLTRTNVSTRYTVEEALKKLRDEVANDGRDRRKLNRHG